MKKFDREFKEATDYVPGTVKVFSLKVIVPILLLVLVGSVIGWGVKIASQPARVIGKTLDADNIIYNYEWFKQTYQDVKAIDRKIENAVLVVKNFKESAGARSEWTFEDKTESSRLNTVVLGLKNQRQDLVATYNARSAMATREIFKTGELPERLE